MVRIWDGKTHVPLGTYQPLGNFAGGLTVAAGDVNGDGADDIVVGVAAGGSPVVTVISGATRRNLGQFMAYGAGYYGGITLGVGDVDNDGRADIAVGPVTSNRMLRIFDGSSISPGRRPDLLVAPLYPFASTSAPGRTSASATSPATAMPSVVGNATSPARLPQRRPLEAGTTRSSADRLGLMGSVVHCPRRGRTATVLTGPQQYGSTARCGCSSQHGRLAEGVPGSSRCRASIPASTSGSSPWLTACDSYEDQPPRSRDTMIRVACRLLAFGFASLTPARTC